MAIKSMRKTNLSKAVEVKANSLFNNKIIKKKTKMTCNSRYNNT